jgi:hypothetical protein
MESLNGHDPRAIKYEVIRDGQKTLVVVTDLTEEEIDAATMFVKSIAALGGRLPPVIPRLV